MIKIFNVTIFRPCHFKVHVYLCLKTIANSSDAPQYSPFPWNQYCIDSVLVTCVVQVSPCQEAGPGRAADGAGGQGVGELHPGICYDLAGGNHGVRAAHGDVLVVSEDEYNVGLGEGSDVEADTELEAKHCSPHGQHPLCLTERP